ncbi:GTP-binding protein [Paenibacillus sp. WST5]|uniref:GTP-binding protein n=2 Tax=Paenibacillus sedimenti TaxID=2770274 RepID=A0A926KVK1_9BACL|nr:GTP-binding protein [Paenibacillus sedimenti]
MNTAIPIYILSGFLGSGKTTFLKKVIDFYTHAGKKPAVIMNEIGDVNLDGLLIDEEVPMAEILGGCVCCTNRGDLSMAILNIVRENSPDIIFIESTGIANPMEIIESVTDASLLLEVHLKSLITVVDAPHLLELVESNQKKKTLRLMEEQVRSANYLIINKMDRVGTDALIRLQSWLTQRNSHALIKPAEYCEVDFHLFDELSRNTDEPQKKLKKTFTTIQQEHHHSHDHVMAYTHYFDHPVSIDNFEQMISKLPKEVYRAKGILRLIDDAENITLFQYAYRELEFVKINPQAKVPNVAVFIGENFSKDHLIVQLHNL